MEDQKNEQKTSHLFLHEKRTWPRKFRDAFRGLKQSIKQQTSYRVHFCFAVIVPIAGFCVHLNLLQWCLLVLCITVVIAAEMFNTALETLAKAITQEHNATIGLALDIASGAVLTTSLGAMFIGILIFVNAILGMLLPGT